MNMKKVNVNPMMFFDRVLEQHQDSLLTAMAAALAECRDASRAAAQLNEEGRIGLMRLMEMWAATGRAEGLVVFEGSDSELLADVLARLNSAIVLNPPAGAIGLTVCVELGYMMECILDGEWFE